MAETPDQVNGSAIEVEQPQPEQISAERAYRIASARLRRAHRDKVSREQSFEAPKVMGDIATLQVDLSVLVNHLAQLGVINLDAFLAGCAVTADHRAAKLQAELDKPKLELPPGVG
jgi:hypothetical protein